MNPAAAPGAADSLFDEAFLRKLAGLQVMVRRAFSGGMRGARRTRRHGRGLEFADHRAYVPGDDIRHVDWHLYARLERPLVRLFEEETDLAIHLLVDRSASMGLGQPRKLDLALRVAAALAHVGAANLDRVAVYALDQSATPLAREPAAGHSLAYLPALARLRAAGSTDLAAGVRAFAARRPRRGLAVLISDFHDPAGHERALSMLVKQRLEVVAMTVASPEEVEPTLQEDLSGEVLLRDAETGAERRLTITPALLSAYRQAYNARAESLSRFCRDRGLTHFRVLANTPFEEVVLRVLRGGGLLR